MKRRLKCIVLLYDSVGYDSKFASDGEIIYFNFDENTTVGDLRSFLREKSSFQDSVYFDLADKERISIISIFGHRKGKINWDLDFEEIKIVDFYRNENIFMNAMPGGIGNFVDVGLIMTILEFVYKVITFLSKRFMTLNKAYKQLSKEIYMDKYSVMNVILKYEKWNIGFISNKDFNKKQIIENKIMKNLGYKKIKSENCWLKK